MAPWRLCNDKDVTLVQYADIKTKILRSCNDSAYMLFYRQLDGDSVPPCTSLPAEVFHHRVAYCLDVHNECQRAMRYPEKSSNKTNETKEERIKRLEDEEALREFMEEEDDFF